ncbi:MAG: S-adenosylmethionine decarboxylase [Methanomassiliicoccaceae archaeon]|jgi:S-adenosylmethionine/arginine decarboxylase-like enzyme|nr:S-adenosylmethionine decarboxylase [Methanomassiliicoccaceae archaeon]
MSPKSGELMSDEKIMARYKNDGEWGLMVSIDIGGCDPKKITSKEHITQFAIDLAEYINMKRYKDPIVVKFGENEKVAGYSLVQLIETSLISGHFADSSERAFIDVFSCREFPPKKTAEYCMKYFGGKTMEYSIAFRN